MPTHKYLYYNYTLHFGLLLCQSSFQFYQSGHPFLFPACAQILSGVDLYLKLLMKSIERKVFQQSFCCACGHSSCRESSDHNFVSLRELKAQIQNGKIPNSELDELKQKASKFYKKLKDQIVAALEDDHTRMQEHLNRFYYPHINTNKINLKQLCQYANGKFTNLPNKNILRTIQELKERKIFRDQIGDNLELQQLAQDFNTYISQFQKRKQLQKFKSHLPFSSIIQKALPKLKLRRSQSEISNPEQIDQQAAKTYMWKNAVIRSKTKVLELSNKNITDNQLLREMPVISSFKNIKDFQIRHNKITAFSCKIIASNMGHVKSVDIRGNPVGDEGVISLIKGLPHLKSFMISQTNCTNLSAVAIINGLKDIEMLWCEHNRVDGPHAILIGQMHKLKVLSFAGNGLDSQTGEKLKKIFNSKGYVIV